MPIKAMTYNLLRGGRDGDDERRLREQMSLIGAQRPDVLFLQEAEGFAEEGARRLFALEAALGMRGFLARAPRTGMHLAIFLRPPLQPLMQREDAAHFHHVLLRLDVTAPRLAAPLSLACAHFCPFGAEERRREATYLNGAIPAQDFALLAGDFNATSPHDPEPPNLARLSPRYRARHLDAALQRADRSALALVEAQGWIDIGQRQGDLTPTVPAAGFADAEFPLHRSDYVFASPALADRVLRYEVLRNAASDRASDHYPILVEFDLAL